MRAIKLILSITALIGLFILSSCGDDDDPGVSNTLSADAGPDQDVNIGQTVFLDGTGSSDSEGGSFEYDWEIISSPDGSNIVLSNVASAQPSFIPDVAGAYNIELTIFTVDGLEDSDIVTINATTSSNVVIINDDINDDMTLTNRVSTPGVPDYCITEDIEVSAVLTIEPGVEISIAANIGILIDDGVLIANGTADNPIVFKAKTSGEKWKGIGFLFSDDFRNTMNFVNITDGGSEALSIIDEKAALGVSSFSALNITNSTIDGSANEGMFVDEGSELGTFSNNTIKNCGGTALIIAAEQIGQLDILSDFSQNNGENRVEITDGNVDLDDPAVWPALANNVPYLITESIDVESQVDISAGATFLFEPDLSLQISSDNAAFKVNGTAELPVQFMAEDPDLPWRGIGFILAGDVRNSINYAEISHAGVDFISISDVKAGLLASSFSTVSITNTTVTNSASNGIYISDGSEIIAFSNNRMQSSTDRPLVLPLDQVGQLDDQSAYSLSNGKDEIEIFESRVNLDEVTTWSAPSDGTPFVITGDIELSSGVIMEPNIEFLFESNIEMIIRNGFLTAIANSDDDRIVFTAYNQDLLWKGIGFVSDDVRNELNFVEVSYAGSDEVFSSGQNANVWVNSFDELKLFNSVISNGNGYGLFVSDDGTVNDGAMPAGIENSNSFSNNAQGNILFEE